MNPAQRAAIWIDVFDYGTVWSKFLSVPDYPDIGNNLMRHFECADNQRFAGKLQESFIAPHSRAFPTSEYECRDRFHSSMITSATRVCTTARSARARSYNQRESGLRM